jgi:hypothetical protein
MTVFWLRDISLFEGWFNFLKACILEADVLRNTIFQGKVEMNTVQ